MTTDHLLIGLVALAGVLLILFVIFLLRRLVGFVINAVLLMIGAVLVLLAIFAGPLGLLDDLDLTQVRAQVDAGVDDMQARLSSDQERPSPATDPEPERALGPVTEAQLETLQRVLDAADSGQEQSE